MRLPLLMSLVVSAAPPALSSEEVRALRERAMAAYQQKRYAEACPLFEQVTRRAPRAGEAWADLALCRFRLKQQDSAVAAAAKALQYGEQQTRLSTYYNLGKFTGGEYGGTRKAGGDDSCWPASAVPGCEREFWRCDNFQRSGGDERGRRLGVGRPGLDPGAGGGDLHGTGSLQRAHILPLLRELRRARQ